MKDHRKPKTFSSFKEFASFYRAKNEDRCMECSPKRDDPKVVMDKKDVLTPNISS